MSTASCNVASLNPLTGQTNAGKTAIVVARRDCRTERKLGEREVERGWVLYLAGENPDDIRMRWIAMSQQMEFDHDTIDVHFVPGKFKISEMYERIRDEIPAIGEVTLIIVDTSAAYFEGDSENDNTDICGTLCCSARSPKCRAARVFSSLAIRQRTPATTICNRVAAALSSPS